MHTHQMQMFCIQNVNWSKCYLWNMSLLVQNMKTIQYCLWLSVLRLLCSHLYTCKKTIWSYIEYMVYGISQIHVIKMCIYTLCDFIDSVACFFWKQNKALIHEMFIHYVMNLSWISCEFLMQFLCISNDFLWIPDEILMKFF
jgi:hypothetical protein